MILYIFPILVILYAIIQYDIANHKNGCENIIWHGLYIYFIILLGLRYGVGGDTINYMNDYIWRQPLSSWKPTLLDSFQPGYTFLCAIAKSVSDEFYVFQFLHAFLFNSLLFVFISKNSKYRFSSLLAVYILCYIYFTTEILRESLAVMVFLFNYSNFESNRWGRYYVGVLFGCLFHISAIFLVLLPLIKWLKFNKYYLLTMIVVIPLMFFLQNILGLITNLTLVGDKVSSYIDDTTHGILADTLTLFRYSVFPMLFVILIKYGLHRSLKYENAIAMMTIFGIAAYFSPIIFSRAVNYFIIFFAISFSSVIIDLIKTKRARMAVNVVIILTSFLFVYGSEYVLYGRYKRFIPYYSIFNPVSVDRDNYK